MRDSHNLPAAVEIIGTRTCELQNASHVLQSLTLQRNDVGVERQNRTSEQRDRNRIRKRSFARVGGHPFLRKVEKIERI